MTNKINSIALITSVAISGLLLIFLLIFDSISGLSRSSVIKSLISTHIIFFINYISIKYLLNLYMENQNLNTLEINSNKNQKNINTNKNIIKETNIPNVYKDSKEIDVQQKMEKYRKEYLGNLSHELKTPLFSIQGYVETLLDGGVEDLNIRDKYLERISMSVDRINNLVEDLDMMGQLEKGEIRLNFEEFNLNELINEVIDLLDLESKNNKTHLVLESNYPKIIVYADKQKIFQVFVNLVSNAIHYTKRVDAIIKISLKIINNSLLIEVSDNGMGIKDKTLPRIFERFFREDSSRSRKDGGSGLGLPIVKHILEAHNQEIRVESVYLEGAKFSFKLDLKNY